MCVRKHFTEVINNTHLTIFTQIVWYKTEFQIGFCVEYYVGEMLRELKDEVFVNKYGFNIGDITDQFRH